MNILLMIHSILRWLIVIVAVIAIVKFALGWLRGGAFKGMDRGLVSGFSGMMDLQATLGLILLVSRGLAGVGFPREHLEHAFTMIVAAVIGHLSMQWKNAEDQIRFRNSLFIVLAVLAVVFIGVSRLPGGWSR